MVNCSNEKLDLVFSALSDATRRGILAQIARHGEASIGELGEPHPMSAPAISKHVRVLEEAGLVTREKQGRNHYLKMNAAPMRAAAAWLETTRAFWEGQLGSLKRYLEEEER